MVEIFHISKELLQVQSQHHCLFLLTNENSTRKAFLHLSSLVGGPYKGGRKSESKDVHLYFNYPRRFMFQVHFSKPFPTSGLQSVSSKMLPSFLWSFFPRLPSTLNFQIRETILPNKLKCIFHPFRQYLMLLFFFCVPQTAKTCLEIVLSSSMRNPFRRLGRTISPILPQKSVWFHKKWSFDSTKWIIKEVLCRSLFSMKIWNNFRRNRKNLSSIQKMR